MLELLFFIFFLAASLPAFNQVFLLQEFFDDPSKLPAALKTIDKDGDAYNWRVKFRFLAFRCPPKLILKDFPGFLN